MQQLYWYLMLSGVLCALLWTPYILARAIVWGIPAFLHNYPGDFPATQPEPPLWAQRAHRAHLNMVETLPAFIAVVVAVASFGDAAAIQDAGAWAAIFFYTRVTHAIVYTVGTPYLRTPVYLVSWFSILAIAALSW